MIPVINSSVIVVVAPQLTDITSCIGDTVIYTCTVNSVAHRWTISSPRRIQTAVTVGTPRVIIPPYSFTLTKDDGSSITSTLSLTVFAAFNGTMITCVDSLAPQGTAAEQSTTAMVFGEYHNVNESACYLQCTYVHRVIRSCQMCTCVCVLCICACVSVCACVLV